jgi:hypothetical protein
VWTLGLHGMKFLDLLIGEASHNSPMQLQIDN